MVNGINGFMKQLLSTFKVEAGEHVQALAEGLVELEKSEGSPNQQEIVERVFRESHSLKGAARSVSISEIEKVCQSMESIFAAVKHHEMTLSASLFDDLHQAVDYLARLLPSIERKRTAEEKAAATGVVHLLENSLKKTQMLPDTDTVLVPTLAAVTEPPLSRPEGDTPIAPAAPEATPLPAPNTEKKQPAYSMTPGAAETVRITTTKLERILMQTEGFLAVKLAAAAQTTSLRQYLGDFDQWQLEWIKIHIDRIRAKKQVGDGTVDSGTAADTLERLLLFLDWNHDFIANMTEKMVKLVKATEEDERSLVRMTDELQLEMKQMLVSSFSSFLVVLPKMVRDLAAEQSKEIDLGIQGAEIEIDRRILEELKDPLIHLLRN
ncbi:MAG: Hpt domain-containing protein, partial [Dehalococcoidales bacterium]|nr:Hpt domain-containing protein [Dehalococcoidales bacterium]